jgi:hypothetical protein
MVVVGLGNVTTGKVVSRVSIFGAPVADVLVPVMVGFSNVIVGEGVFWISAFGIPVVETAGGIVDGPQLLTIASLPRTCFRAASYAQLAGIVGLPAHTAGAQGAEQIIRPSKMPSDPQYTDFAYAVFILSLQKLSAAPGDPQAA